jgi:spore maturation protein CgeB
MGKNKYDNSRSKEMRILIVGEFYEESFAQHILENFQYLNHDTRSFSIIPKPSFIGFLNNGFIKKFYYYLDQIVFARIPKIRDFKLGKLLNVIRDFKPDLILLTYDYLYADQVEEIKKLDNGKIVMWSPDSVATVASGKSHFLNSAYDHLFFKDKFIVNNLANTLNLNAHYLPECFNHYRHKFSGFIEDKYKVDITTAGNLHSYRVAFFRNLIDEKYKITIWGYDAPDWLNSNDVRKFYQGHPVFNEEKAKVFLGSKIVLNNLLISEVEGVNVRTFEAAGIGAFQLVDHRSCLEDLFKVGEEIISFHGINDLKEKIEFYISRPDLRNQIAEKAKIRALQDHTYEVRLKQMLDIIF